MISQLLKKQTHQIRAIAIIFAALLCASSLSSMAPAQDAEKITFDDHITPIFRARCANCHNANKKSADLDVTNYTALMMGGGSGEVIIPGDSIDSFLYGVVTHEEAPEMPPNGKLPDDQIALIKKWIDGGALENKGSKAVIAKPKTSMEVGESAMTRPAVMPMPGRLPLEPGLVTPRQGAVTAMTISPWAPLVAIAAPGQIVLYDTSNLQLAGVIPLPVQQDRPTSAFSMRFSRSGSLLVAGVGRAGASGKVMIWNVVTGDLITTLADELDSILALDISPDQSMVALGGPGKDVKVLSTGDGSLIYQIKKHTDWVTAIEFSPDGSYLATGDRNGGLHLWLADAGDEHQTLKAHTNSITAVSWRSDGKVLASVSEDKFGRLWEAETGKAISGAEIHGGGATSIHFNRDGNLCTTGRDNRLRFLKPDGSEIATFENMADVALVARYCEETKRIICADWTGNVRVFNAVDGAAIGTLQTNPPDLATRLATAKASATAASNEYQPLEGKKAELDKLIAETSGSMQTTTAQRDAMNAKLGEISAAVTAAQQQLDSTKANRSQWRSELAQQNEALPLVKESHAKAVEASTALPADADLKTSADKMAEKITQIEARTNELNSLVTKSVETQQQTRAALDQKKAELAEMTTQRDQLNQKIVELETETGSLNDQLAGHVKLLEAARAKLDSANAAVTRWTGEIEFVAQLKQLTNQLTEATSVVSEHVVRSNEAQEKVAVAQAELDAARQQQQQARATANEIEQKILQLKQK